MKSLLQLDTKLHSQDSLIHEQNDKLAEKDRIIKNNQAEIERWEKRIMMQELKVKNKLQLPYCKLLIGRCVDHLFFVMSYMIVSDQHSTENH